MSKLFGEIKRNFCLSILIALSVLFGAVARTQTATKQVSAVVAEGSVKDGVYSNSYLGITITAPDAKFTVPSLVNEPGRRARLLNAVYDSPDGAKNYTIGLMVDSVENYPKTMSTVVYVRSVRHQLEKDGLLTEREEFPLTIPGLAFTGAILKVPEKPDFGYRRGIYSTFRNGYVLSLEIQARDQKRIQQVLSSAVKIAAPK
jgi:hypothetical protein